MCLRETQILRRPSLSPGHLNIYQCLGLFEVASTLNCFPLPVMQLSAFLAAGAQDLQVRVQAISSNTLHSCHIHAPPAAAQILLQLSEFCDPVCHSEHGYKGHFPSSNLEQSYSIA